MRKTACNHLNEERQRERKMARKRMRGAVQIILRDDCVWWWERWQVVDLVTISRLHYLIYKSFESMCYDCCCYCCCRWFLLQSTVLIASRCRPFFTCMINCKSFKIKYEQIKKNKRISNETIKIFNEIARKHKNTHWKCARCLGCDTTLLLD